MQARPDLTRRQFITRSLSVSAGVCAVGSAAATPAEEVPTARTAKVSPERKASCR
jgi:hypothetical protein